jgi:deoxyribonuclease-2
VRNVVELKWHDGVSVVKEEDYVEQQDHSKWAVSDSAEDPWVFVGDINRMPSQHHRGGGGVVIRDAALWRAFTAMIVR